LFKKKIAHLFISLFWITPLLLLQLPGKSQVLTDAGAATIAQSNSQSDPSHQRRETAERFLDLLFSQQYEAATRYISPIVKSEFPADVLREKVEAFQRGAGAFVTRLDSQVEGDIVIVNLRFEQGERTFVISFDENLNILNANYVFELMMLPNEG
jgi:hypothetical protein